MNNRASAITFKTSAPPVFAQLFADANCKGGSTKLSFPTDGSPEVSISFWELLFTSVGNDNLSAVSVPTGYELVIWEHDFHGERRSFSGAAGNMSCQNITDAMN